MFHPYTIVLNNGKYTVINNNGIMTFLRYGEAWDSDLKYSNVALAMAQRIEELEIAIREVLDGSLDARGSRRDDGMIVSYCSQFGAPQAQTKDWAERLRRALEQK